jgi:hypothetical protein
VFSVSFVRPWIAAAACPVATSEEGFGYRQ